MRKTYIILFLLCLTFSTRSKADNKQWPQYIDTSATYNEAYRHDPEMKLYFLYPDKMKTGIKYPTLIFFFGGSWVTGSVQNFAKQGLELAKLGMIVVLADYRIKHRDGTTPIESVEDAKSAIRYLKANADRLQIDTSKLVAGGSSAGAHLAACTALVKGFNAPNDNLKISSVPKALLLISPVINNAPAPEGYGYGRLKSVFPQISPYHNIDNNAPRNTLILLGTEDKIIPIETIMSFKNKMEEFGCTCEVELYDGAGHGFHHYKEDSQDNTFFYSTLERIIEFFKEMGYVN